MAQIYQHIAPNGKSYVGCTKTNWENRAGKNPLQTYRASSRKFARAIEKIGWDNFEHKVLEEVSVDIMYKQETFWIQKLDTIKNGYNVCRGGHGLKHDFCIEDDAKLLLERYSLGHIENLYKDRSLRQVAEILEVSFLVVYKVITDNNIPVHDKNFRSSYSTRKKFENDIKCAICNKEFTIYRRGVKTCSKSCSSQFGHKNSDYDYARNRKNRKTRNNTFEEMVGNTRAKGNKGGLITSHKRWHIDRGLFNEKCILCQESSQ